MQRNTIKADLSFQQVPFKRNLFTKDFNQRGSMKSMKVFMNHLVTLSATLFVGKVFWIPGTVGSFVAVLFWWALSPETLLMQISLIAVAFVLGTLAVHFYEKWNHCHDPREVVVDELIGQWISFVTVSQEVPVLICGFFLFRFFDIWKPFPANWIDQKMPGALGTVLDDGVAGVYTCLLLKFIFDWSSFDWSFIV